MDNCTLMIFNLNVHFQMVNSNCTPVFIAKRKMEIKLFLQVLIKFGDLIERYL